MRSAALRVAVVAGAAAALFASAASAGEQLSSAAIEILDPRRDVADFALADTGGRTVRLGALRGRVVLLHVWATWCAACVEDMPTMEALGGALRDREFSVLALNLMEEPEVVAEFLRTVRVTFPVLLDDGAIGIQYAARGIPASYLIDRRGRLAARSVGARDWTAEASRRLIERLLAEP